MSKYRVILTQNGKYKKTLWKCEKRTTAFIRFRKIKDDNKILFPKKFINTKGIKPVKYRLYIVKNIESNDKFRLLKDKLGKQYIEKPIFGIWTVLDDSNYEFEEDFLIYGKKERLNIKGILKMLSVGAYKKDMVKQVIVVYNKLIIHNEEQFDMVICKCMDDAQRLHHALAKAAKHNKIKSLLFMGTASSATISRMYEIIHEYTKWPMTKIRRYSTKD